MRTQKIVLFTLLATLIFGSCAPYPKSQNNSKPDIVITPTDLPEENNFKPVVLSASVDRHLSDALPNPDLMSLVDGNNKFAVSMYQALNKEIDPKNLVFSPHSISLALAMTYAGAGGKTAAEMKQVLKITLPQERYHQSWNNLDQWLAIRSNGKNNIEEGYNLRITNAVWAQQGYPFLDTYLNLLARYYGSGLQTTDFEKYPEESRFAINQWAADQTEQKIKDVIPAGAIHPLTRMALVNAIYLSAPWLQPFDEKITNDGLFSLPDGRRITVPFMVQTQNIPYYVDDSIKMVALPYSGDQLSMIIIMPEAGTFQQFISQLDIQEINSLMDKQNNGEVEIKVPRFRLENDFNLNEILEKLGMNLAFDLDQADFSGMEPARELYIDQVIHKAYIDVNEAGTEAAAATAVLMTVKGFNPEEPQMITFDHPFLFIIQDNESGAILFIGQVINPNGESESG